MADRGERDIFAQQLIQDIRDRAIEVCDQHAHGKMRGPSGQRWRDLIANKQVRSAVLALIPDIVDEVLFTFLDLVDNGVLPLGWRRSDGTFVDLEVLGGGEMAGWYMMGKGGWLDRFSRQRYADDLDGVALDWPIQSSQEGSDRQP